MTDSNTQRSPASAAGSLRVGVVGVPGGWSTEHLADCLDKRTGFRLVIDMANVSARLHERCATYRDVDLCRLDAIVIKKLGENYSTDMLDRLEVLRFIEACGVRCFSRPAAILRLLDRASCTVTLANHGIPMPPTVLTESVAEAAEAVRSFERAILKPLYSTKARGMLMLRGDASDLDEQLTAYARSGNPLMYVQKMLELPGKDLGVMFLGGRYMGTYARVGNKDSWNTTIHSGGRYQAHEPDTALIELARRAQAPFELDLTSVDVVETNGGPMVFEVSAFGGFSGLRDGCGRDAADEYASYVVAQLRGERS